MTAQTTIVGERAAALVPRGESRPARIWRNCARFARRQPIGAFAAVVLIVMVLSAIFAEVIAPFSATRNDVGPSLVGPSRDHLMGTDQFGRDIFSRIVYGARISLYVGLITTLLGTGVATILGSVSGYRGGAFDYLLQRFVDAAQAIPPLILLIGVMVVLEPSVTNVILALAFRQALSTSRVVRSAVISIRTHAYVEAARTLGATHVRILALHLLPNVLPVIVVLVSTSIGGLIVAEASLSFLGYGVPPPTPSWGGMMSSEGRIYMLAAPWILIFPTVVLSMVVFAMNMFGDALRDEFDPRLRGSR
jgi:peptide/nickel transport system permease protein